MTASDMFIALSGKSKDGTVLIPFRGIAYAPGQRIRQAWGHTLGFEIEYVGESNRQRWRLQAIHMNELFPGLLSPSEVDIYASYVLGKFRLIPQGGRTPDAAGRNS